MIKEFTCIICPNGCEITTNFEDGKIKSLEGAQCIRGNEYVQQELTNPLRNIASSVKLEGGVLPLASVRLTKNIPKNRIFEVMEIIKKISIKAPVHIGEIIISNILDTESDVIITKNVAKK